MHRSTPYLSVDLSVVRARFAELRAALPGARVFYSVKANPAPRVLATLAGAGAGFDVASVGELRLALAAGATPATLCHANPVRTATDVLEAARAGVGLFVTDSAEDLAVLSRHAPGAEVLVRLAVDEDGAATPFGGKFGCSRAEAAGLLRRAGTCGLRPVGLSFHVGSQQLRPGAWRAAVEAASAVVADAGWSRLPLLDVGGGFPVRYREDVPSLDRIAGEIRAAVRTGFPDDPPELAVEPGRFLVAEAGVLHASVVRVSRRHDGRRWVYLDVGRYGGLAETEGEAIGYRLATAHDGRGSGQHGGTAPAVLAGPTCDGDDVLYREVELPVALRAGDRIRIMAAGAYTASYSAVGFNGLPPLPVICHDSDGSPGPPGRLPDQLPDEVPV